MNPSKIYDDEETKSKNDETDELFDFVIVSVSEEKTTHRLTMDDDESYDYCGDVFSVVSADCDVAGENYLEDEVAEEDIGNEMDDNCEHLDVSSLPRSIVTSFEPPSLKDSILTVSSVLMKELDEAHSAVEKLKCSGVTTMIDDLEENNGMNKINSNSSVVVSSTAISGCNLKNDGNVTTQAILSVPSSLVSSDSKGTNKPMMAIEDHSSLTTIGEGKQHHHQYSAVHKNSNVSTSRTSNKKRRKKLKLQKKAQAAAIAARKLSEKQQQQYQNLEQNRNKNKRQSSSSTNRAIAPNRSLSKIRSSSNTNIAVACALQSMKSYKEELIRQGTSF